LDDQLAAKTNFEDFFAQAPQMNPSRSSITGVICGVRVEDIEENTMREIRYLDKLIVQALLAMHRQPTDDFIDLCLRA
ncbi:DUF2200 family protein, partial [Rhizobium johnstonii]|uniref:DUF2200 family protein n=1 Tax=Rhizobium johnstonii TaxID=3019933 RepID=UPI003F99360D